jgi:RNA polymerase sigma-70 factor, ECF subfamily
MGHRLDRPDSVTLAAVVAIAHSPEDVRLIDGLRTGDEAAFVLLLDRYGASMLRLATTFVGSRAVAEEVVQETWLAVLQGIDRFEGRASLKTWLFRILTNRAKTRAEREGRTLPFSALAEASEEGEEPSVDPDRFFGPDHRFGGHWTEYPQRWDDVPERRLLSRETRELIAAAIEQLPPVQQAVISLRDVKGWSSEEVCNALDLSETNQRVLLHRARTKVRRALEDYLS